MDCIVYRTVRGSPSVSWVQNVLKVIERRVPRNVKQRSLSTAVLFVGDRRMQTLNRLYRSVDRPTDVLAFPLDTGHVPKQQSGIGDVIINVPYVKRQARRFDVSFEEECARMLTHGVLHLLGYTHAKRMPADTMFRLQEIIVNAILA